MTDFLPLLDRYRALLEAVDGWFARSQQRAGDEIRCGKGCAACCRGLFDITLLDAALLQQGVARLSPGLQKEVRERARQRLPELERRWPGFSHPYLLNHLPAAEWTEMPEQDMTPCALLGADGACLAYAFRPMVCRLHGLPHIDISGEVFDETWCTLNFSATDPLTRRDLRWEFRRVFGQEIDLFRQFARQCTGAPHDELDTFIPTALLIDFSRAEWPRKESA